MFPSPDRQQFNRRIGPKNHDREEAARRLRLGILSALMITSGVVLGKIAIFDMSPWANSPEPIVTPSPDWYSQEPLPPGVASQVEPIVDNLPQTSQVLEPESIESLKQDEPPFALVTGGEPEVKVMSNEEQISQPTLELATSNPLKSENQGEIDSNDEIANIIDDLVKYIGSNWNIFIYVFAGLKAILRDKEFKWSKFVPNTIFEFGKLACIENTFELVPNITQIGAGMGGLYLLKALFEHLTSGEGFYALPKVGVNIANYGTDIVTSAMSPVSAMLNTVQGVYPIVEKYMITPLAKKGLGSAWGWFKSH